MKRGQFNFVWIFAILAGGAILALAIWGAVQGGDILRYKGDTEAGLRVSVLTDPLQAGFSEISYGKISFSSETRLNNICFNDGSFGKNDISVSTRSGVGNEWNLAGGATSVHNKYIFSRERMQGFEFGVLSAEFLFPYQVNDLIFLIDREYCFFNAPQDMVDQISGMGIDLVKLENCSSGATRVCFGGGERNCDIMVYGSCSGNCDSIYDEGTVSKSGGEIDYVGSLIWGAIFSDVGNYECNLERLFFRSGKIADILIEKSDLMDARDCSTNLKGDLIGWRNVVQNSSAGDLLFLNGASEKLVQKNDREICKLW